MSELARVTRPGGSVAITAWGRAQDCEMAGVFQALMRLLPEAPRGGGPFALGVPGALEGLLENAGLRVVQRGQTRCTFVAPSWDECWRGMESAGPMQGAMRVAGREAVHDALREAVQVPSNEEPGGRVR